MENAKKSWKGKCQLSTKAPPLSKQHLGWFSTLICCRLGLAQPSTVHDTCTLGPEYKAAVSGAS